MTQRRSWKESLKWLKGKGVTVPRTKVTRSSELSDRPEPGDSKFKGLRFADAVHEEIDFENLTLPRTLFERCRFHGVSLRGTDLSLSCLDGNDWIDCDFSDGVLICAWMRNAVFFGCRFINCQLIGADLRGSTLTGCDFTGANITGARLLRPVAKELTLSEPQRSLMIDWRTQMGDEEPDEE
jgi:uncharacterized protein YjbI with pentapeptide repeats